MGARVIHGKSFTRLERAPLKLSILDDTDYLDAIGEFDLETGSPEQRESLKRKREIQDTIAVRKGTPPEWAR